jgi:hypothetical protein
MVWPSHTMLLPASFCSLGMAPLFSGLKKKKTLKEQRKNADWWRNATYSWRLGVKGLAPSLKPYRP